MIEKEQTLTPEQTGTEKKKLIVTRVKPLNVTGSKKTLLT